MCMRTSYFGIQMESPGFRAVLGSAVLEWLLIILLFIDALFSYLVTKFARFCKLPVPCLLCSRLDHVLGNKKPGFYRDLICKSHKLEISSLAFCNTHNKLADVHGLCEGCLFSFATENKSNSETCRLLVGKLGIDPECRSNQDQLPGDTKLDSSSERQCTCCKESWSLRSYTHSFVQTKSVEPEVSELEDPLLGSVGTSHLHSGDDLKKRREETSDLVTSSNVRSNCFDPLSRIGYTELKITSDSESEAHFSDDNGSPLVREIEGVKEEVVVQCNPLSRIGYTELKITSDSDSEAHFSDNDGGSPLVREIDGVKEEVVVQCNQPDEAHTTIPENLLEIPSNDLAPEKLIHQDFVPESSLLFPDVQRDVEKPHDETSLASAIAIGHGLEELNWHEEQKATPSPPPEFISKHEIAPSTDVEEALVDVHGLEELNWHEEQKATPSPPPELISKNEISPSVDVEEALVDVHGLEELNWHEEQKTTPSPPSELISKHEIASSDKVEEALIDVPDLISKHEIAPSVDVEEALVDDSAEILDVEETGKSEEACKSDSELTKTTGTGLKKDLVLNIKIPPVIPNLMDLSEAYKLAIGNRSPVVGLLGEQLIGKSSLRDKDDQKLLMSQVSATRGLDSPLNGMSPRVHGLAEELKSYDDSSSMGLHVLQKRISLERNESGLSLDGSLVSEIEGESVVDRLRRQVEYDRKSMYALYRELEEERNASAVSANQAMAMITRLQEEKSTLHMEALQYLRMMEEQSEYDVEALQKANDLLVDKEKELQDLEAELEVYRNQSDSYEKILKASHLKGGDMGAGHSGIRCIENEASVSCDSTPGEKSQGGNNTEKNDGMYGGKYNISKDSLLDFEDERLYISQCLEKLEKQLHLFSNNGVHLDIPNGEYTPKEPSEPDNLEQLHFSKPTQESSQVEVDGFSGQKDSSLSRGHSQEMSTPLVGDTLVDSNVHNHSDGQDATLTNETDLVALENEVSDLNERLKALEADRNFLEHTINSLRNGDEGVKFIQEIANHLQELRKIGIRREQVIL